MVRPGAWVLALALAAAAGAAPAQTPPPTTLEPLAPPPASSGPPAPPPLVLLPPAAPEAPASDAPAAKPPPPPKRPRRIAAILQALDKTTAESMRFEAPVNQPVRWKDLVFTVHVCEDDAPEQGQRGAAAHLEIASEPRPAPGRGAAPTRQLFRGWMFSAAPGVHPFEHPVYDAWLIGCRASTTAPQ